MPDPASLWTDLCVASLIVLETVLDLPLSTTFLVSRSRDLSAAASRHGDYLKGLDLHFGC